MNKEININDLITIENETIRKETIEIYKQHYINNIYDNNKILSKDYIYLNENMLYEN